MKKHIVILTIVALVVGVTLNSCKKKGCMDETATNYDENAKKEDNTCVYPENEAPVITINEPTESMYHLMNDTAIIPISVSVSDDESLHSVVLTLTNTTDSDEVIHIHLHPDATTASIDTSYTATVAHRDYELTVTAEDHHEKSTTETVHTHVHMM